MATKSFNIIKHKYRHPQIYSRTHTYTNSQIHIYAYKITHINTHTYASHIHTHTNTSAPRPSAHFLFIFRKKKVKLSSSLWGQTQIFATLFKKIFNIHLQYMHARAFWCKINRSEVKKFSLFFVCIEQTYNGPSLHSVCN